MTHRHHPPDSDEKLLEKILKSNERLIYLAEQAAIVDNLIARAVLEIQYELRPHPPNITSFILEETTMLPIAPGQNPVFTATPVPSTSVPSTPPTWVSSDNTNAPISVDPTGLIATVNIPTSAVVGTSFTLTISYTNADGTVATGTTTQTIVAPPSPDITSFTIAQTT